MKNNQNRAAGPVLDREIAERVMGWKFGPNPTMTRDVWTLPDGSVSLAVDEFSTDIVQAMEVVDWLRRSRNYVNVAFGNGVKVTAWSIDGADEVMGVDSGPCDTLPLAICLAALSVVNSQSQETRA